MTDDHNAERALETMRDLAPQLAKAKAERTHLEKFRKSKKAILFNQAPDYCSTIPAKENYAYSHKDYIAILDALKIAVEEEEELRWRMKSAELYVEVYRTQSANNRRIDRAHT